MILKIWNPYGLRAQHIKFEWNQRQKFSSFSKGGPFDACWFSKSQCSDLDRLWQTEMDGQTHLNVEIVVSIDVQTSKILYGNKF